MQPTASQSPALASEHPTNHPSPARTYFYTSESTQLLRSFLPVSNNKENLKMQVNLLRKQQCRPNGPNPASNLLRLPTGKLSALFRLKDRQQPQDHGQCSLIAFLHFKLKKTKFCAANCLRNRQKLQAMQTFNADATHQPSNRKWRPK